MADALDSCHVAEAGDPDVAGLGVIVAFLASICITTMTVLTLYVWEWLPTKQYNRIDRLIIQPFRKTFDEADREADAQHQRAHKVMQKTLQELLCQLSDQHLFFGLTLVLTIYIRLSDIDAFSAYSFKISTTSVWLSCLTQMSAVVALRDRFYPKGGRGWRVAAMIVLLILLAPILLLSNLPTFIFDPSLSVRCALSQISTYDRATTLNFALLAASTVVMTVGGYTGRIIALYRPMRRRSYIRQWKQRHISEIERHEATGRWPRTLKIPWLRVLFQLVQGLKESFLWQLLWLLFYLTFGITSLILAWTLVPPREQWSLSFGQLVPLILLVSVFPPIYDTFRGHIRNALADTSSRSQTESDSGIESNSAIDSNSALDPESEDDLPSSLSICLKLLGTRGHVFLILVILVTVAWHLFMGLLTGGAFFTAMRDSPLRGWTGVNISVCGLALAPTAGQAIQASYRWLEVQVREQVRVQTRVQARVQARVQGRVQGRVQARAQHRLQTTYTAQTRG